MRHFLIALLILGLANTAWTDDEPDAADVVKAYVEAFLTIDYEAAQAVLCEADLETLDQTEFEQALEAVTELNYTADLSDLTYDTLELGETLAEVSISGDIRLEIESQSQPVMVDPLDLRLDRVWAVYEDESWKACFQVPPELSDDLGPDVIARIFMDAAFRGNYEQAHRLVCAAELDTLSEAEFEQIFGQFLEQDLHLNFHDTLFEITEQTAESAVVTLAGDVWMTMGERPSPNAIAAKNLGLSSVYLSYEDGWKICNAEAVES
jgi:hypothetical protein